MGLEPTQGRGFCTHTFTTKMRNVWKEGTSSGGVPLENKKLIHTRKLDEWVPVLTGEPIPPRQRMLSPREASLLETQVRTWLKEGVIEARPRQALNNNLVFVAKSNGDVRVCDDCTPVNAVTEDYDWPLPRLQDIRLRTTNAKWMTRLDLKSAFFRIKVPARYRYLTSFTSGGRQYQFRRMAFGLKTAPAIFQQFMDTHLARYYSWSLCYIDDILIWGTTKPELENRVRQIRRKLTAMGSEVNEDKSEHCKQSLVFAGLYLFSSGVGPDIRKMRQLVELPPPQTKKDMQSALGLVSYLRDFIPLQSHFTAKLYPSKTSVPLSTAEYTQLWERLVRHIQSAANTLRHFDEGEDADLYCDASGWALGVIIIQKGKIVAVTSRKLSPAETRYSATDREHLALVHAARRFRVFLHRDTSRTNVWSDHAALIGRRSEALTPRQARWQDIVTCWIPNARHVKGINNPADYISRLSVEIQGGALKL